MITCTRKLNWCSGHRVVGQGGKCERVHGHEYMAEVTAIASSLDGVGRVIDFGVLKQKLQTWVDINWDHRFLAWDADPIWGYRQRFITNRKPCDASPDRALVDVLDDSEKLGTQIIEFDKRQLGFVYVPFNPTAENIASHLLDVVGPRELGGTGVSLHSVVVHETPKCYATAAHL